MFNKWAQKYDNGTAVYHCINREWETKQEAESKRQNYILP